MLLGIVPVKWGPLLMYCLCISSVYSESLSSREDFFLVWNLWDHGERSDWPLGEQQDRGVWVVGMVPLLRLWLRWGCTEGGEKVNFIACFHNSKISVLGGTEKMCLWTESNFPPSFTPPPLCFRRRLCMRWRWSAACSRKVSRTSARTSSRSMARLWLTCSWRQQILKLCVSCWNAVQPASFPSSQVEWWGVCGVQNELVQL